MPIDLFISYKSEDANVVRAVAERLMHLGLEVWFAEYRVLPSNYECFEELYLSGAKASKYALIFSNNRWAHSPDCRKEMSVITDNFRGEVPERVMEVCIPEENEPHAVYPRLREARRMVYEGDVGQVVRWVAEHVLEPAVEDDLAPAPDLNSAQKWESDFGVRLAVGPFRESKPARLINPVEHVSREELHVFYARLCYFDVRMGVIASPFSRAIDKISIEEDGNSPDRQVYNTYRKYAKEWLRGQNFEELGLHLVFLGGRSHMALTYLNPNEKDPDMTDWERRYAIGVRDPKTGEEGEIDVVFAVSFPTVDRNDAIRRIYGLIPTLDAVVATFEYAPVTKWYDPRTIGDFFTTAILCGAVSYLLILSSAWGPTSQAALAFIAGALWVDILLSVLRPKLLGLERRFKVPTWFSSLMVGLTDVMGLAGLIVLVFAQWYLLFPLSVTSGAIGTWLALRGALKLSAVSRPKRSSPKMDAVGHGTPLEPGTARALIKEGIDEIRRQRFSRAEERFVKSIELGRKLGDRQTVSEAYFQLGYLFSEAFNRIVGEGLPIEELASNEVVHVILRGMVVNNALALKHDPHNHEPVGFFQSFYQQPACLILLQNFGCDVHALRDFVHGLVNTPDGANPPMWLKREFTDEPILPLPFV